MATPSAVLWTFPRPYPRPFFLPREEMGTPMPRGTMTPEATQRTETPAGMRAPAPALVLVPVPQICLMPQICRTWRRLAGLGDQDANLKPQGRWVGGQAGRTGGRKLAGPARPRPGWESGGLLSQPVPWPQLPWTRSWGWVWGVEPLQAMDSEQPPLYRRWGSTELWAPGPCLQASIPEGLPSRTS